MGGEGDHARSDDMILSCYACGEDINGIPSQLPAVAKEGIEHHLCAECAHMIGHARVFRFVTRCVNNAVKPYLYPKQEPAPDSLYDQELAGALGNPIDERLAEARRLSEQLMRAANIIELQGGVPPRPRCCCCGGRFHP